MTLKEIFSKSNELAIYEKRCITDEYWELVLLNKEIDKWNDLLIDTMGLPIKPKGTKPTKEELSLAKDYGGIWKDQVLFKKELSNGILIAMFWPWQDSLHTTLKIAFLKK
jgi:hypothetical protein